jgi:hypothetical protein
VSCEGPEESGLLMAYRKKPPTEIMSEKTCEVKTQHVLHNLVESKKGSVMMGVWNNEVEVYHIEVETGKLNKGFSF